MKPKEDDSDEGADDWMMTYGDYLKEAGYASRKIGIKWVDIS